MDGWYFLVRLGILEISSEPRGGILIRCHDVGADLKKSRESKSVRLVRSQVRPEFQLQSTPVGHVTCTTELHYDDAAAAVSEWNIQSQQ